MSSALYTAYPTVLRQCSNHIPLYHKFVNRSSPSIVSFPFHNTVISSSPSSSSSLSSFRFRTYATTPVVPTTTNSGSVYCRISRLTMLVNQDTNPGIEFYTEAIKLRNDITNNSNTRNIVLSDGSLSNEAGSCSVVFVPTKPTTMVSSSSIPTTPPTLRYPYLTFGVSNLKTSSRHAKRKGGIVIENIPSSSSSSSTVSSSSTSSSGVISSAIFIDPYGQGMRALHVFRRNPAISITLGSKSIDTLSKFYIEGLGMRLLDPSEITQEIKLLPSQINQCIVLGYGAAHNTTSLILEPIGTSGAIKISEESNHTNEEIDNVPVIGIRIHDDNNNKTNEGTSSSQSTVPQLDKLFEIYQKLTTQFNCAASPFDRTKHTSFTFIDPEGYVIYVYI